MSEPSEISQQPVWVRLLPGFVRARLAGRSSLQAILSNTGWLALDRVVRMGVGVIVTVLVARYLGPHNFGTLSFAQAFVALFGTVTGLGLDLILVREIVKDLSLAGVMLGTAVALRASASLLAMAAAIAIAYAMDPHDRISLIVVSILSLSLALQVLDTLDAFYQSQVQSKLTVWSKNTAFLVMAGWRLVLIHMKAQVWAFAAAQILELTLGAMGMVICYRWMYGGAHRWRFQKRLALDLLRQCWPVILSSMAVMVYMRIDMVMLKAMQGDTAVGLYNAATRISEVWYFIPMAMVSSASPAIIRTRPNRDLYYRRLQQMFSFLTMFAVIVGSAMALSSHAIVRLLYSTAYQPAGAILAVHIWAGVFVFQGVAQSVWDYAEDMLKLSMYRTVTGAILNVGLNLILIPRLSGMGAAISTVIAYAVASVFANAFDRRTRPIFYMQMKAYLPTALWRRDRALNAASGE